ncbi:hypothetical protein AB0880_02180 [Micromonospora chersina]|uniref:hypothetical protein n=1 Tax=Micromonospora chersina TaxID=47854 RepID=UPI0034554D60
MTPGTQPGAKPEPRKTSTAALVWIVVLLVVCCGGLVVYPSWGMVFGADGSDKVPAPTAQERGDTVPILAQSTAGQGVCYGWVLKDYWEYGDEVVSAGSNLGDGVRVEGNAACTRWMQVTAVIRYVSESSESNDTAQVEVTGSPDIDSDDLWRMRSGLERLGLTDKVFIDDPGWAITRAAVMLPLLAAEAEIVPPAAATPTPGAASPSPLPDAGSDLLRDRWGYLLATVGLLLLAALFVTVGVVQRRRQRRVAVPAQRAGAGAAGRTREKA